MLSDIILDHVGKKYHNETIIENFSYKFLQGNRYCIMGASGIGKTTLIRMIMGTEEPNSGRIIGADRYSAVFQENRLVEELTPLTNVRMVLKRGMEEQIRTELLKVLPESCVNKKCSELSGGQKRRVAIVRAMMADSDCIVMDEPFAGLDEESVINVMAYITENQNHRTLLIVTHDSEDAERLDAEICLLTSRKPLATIT